MQSFIQAWLLKSKSIVLVLMTILFVDRPVTIINDLNLNLNQFSQYFQLKTILYFTFKKPSHKQVNYGLIQ